jgi:hypothetical protein
MVSSFACVFELNHRFSQGELSARTGSSSGWKKIGFQRAVWARRVTSRLSEESASSWNGLGMCFAGKPRVVDDRRDTATAISEVGMVESVGPKEVCAASRGRSLRVVV